MKISDYAIDRPRLVTVGTLCVILLAIYTLLATPVQLSPAITKAVVLVAVPYPDSRPDESENEIARKIEEVLNDLEKVDFIASTNMRGTSITQIVFLDGVEPDAARAEVQDLVERVRNEFPAGREVQPLVTKIDFENMPLMLVSIIPPDAMDPRELKQIAEDIQEELEQVKGVSNTQLFGGHEREIHVNVHPDRMTQYGVSLAQLRQALSDFHAEVPGGAFDTGEFDRTIRNEAEFRDVDDIREAIVTSQEGRVIRVSDVADVRDASRKRKNLAQINGNDAATIVVGKNADINTLKAANEVSAKVDELRQRFPDLQFYISRDSSQEIWVMFRVLGSSAIFGAMLVLVILGWTMGLRISMLVLIAIPFSMAVAVEFLFAAGVPLSNMVVFSFILVLGMVVDGAIIVAENIHRHIERGEDPTHAAKVGIAEVGIPVIAADLTTIAAFLPMLLVPGIMGDFMGVMPKVVSVALLGSVIVDHFVIPTLAARWYKKREISHDESQSFAALAGSESHEYEGSEVRVRASRDFVTLAYASVLRFSLSGAKCLFVLAWAGIALWGACVLFMQIGFNFFPASDRGQFTVKYELPLGYSIEETLAAAKVITDRVDDWKETGILVNYVTSVGSASGMATRVDDDPATGPEFGEVQVQLVPPMDRDVHSQEVIDYLRKNIQPLPGMKFRVEMVEDGPPGGADVSVRISGEDLPRLGNMAQMLADRLDEEQGTVDASTDFRPDIPELVIEPKPEIAGLFGITEMQLARAVATAIAGDNSIEITLDDEDVDIRLQLAPEYKQSASDLKRLQLGAADGRTTTIGAVTDFRRDVGLYSINRYERSRANVAKCDVVAPMTAAKVFAILSNTHLPELGFKPVEGGELSVEGIPKFYVGKPGTPAEGLSAEFTGENDERDENFAYLLTSMIIAVVLIFAILAVQFNSFRQATIVMFTVPLSFIGVVLGMWAFGFQFSLASFIGVVALTGIVVNDAIVMVDFTNQARARGLRVRDALLEAGINRLRPVMLTTVTTIGGLLPLLLNISGGAEFWQPLTGAVVFGLAFATILTLLVVPCAYLLAYRTPMWVLRLKATVLVALILNLFMTSFFGSDVALIGVSALLLAGMFWSAQEFIRAFQAREALIWNTAL